ncbi:MAG: hypothetical protein GY719_13330 [bacterium]|nr:hypothetical protein [bacterium]
MAEKLSLSDVAGLDKALKAVEKSLGQLQGTATGAAAALEGLAGVQQQVVDVQLDQALDSVNTALEALGGRTEAASEAMQALAEGQKEVSSAELEKELEKSADAVAELTDTVADAEEEDIFQWLGKQLKPYRDQANRELDALADDVNGTVEEIAQELVDGLRSGVEASGVPLVELADGFRDFVRQADEAMTSARETVSGAMESIQSFPAETAEQWQEAGVPLKQLGVTYRKFRERVSEEMSAVSESMGSVAGSIKSSIDSAAGAVQGFGNDAVDALGPAQEIFDSAGIPVSSLTGKVDKLKPLLAGLASPAGAVVVGFAAVTAGAYMTGKALVDVVAAADELYANLVPLQDIQGFQPIASEDLSAIQNTNAAFAGMQQVFDQLVVTFAAEVAPYMEQVANLTLRLGLMFLDAVRNVAAGKDMVKEFAVAVVKNFDLFLFPPIGQAIRLLGLLDSAVSGLTGVETPLGDVLQAYDDLKTSMAEKVVEGTFGAAGDALGYLDDATKDYAGTANELIAHNRENLASTQALKGAQESLASVIAEMAKIQQDSSEDQRSEMKKLDDEYQKRIDRLKELRKEAKNNAEAEKQYIESVAEVEDWHKREKKKLEEAEKARLAEAKAGQQDYKDYLADVLSEATAHERDEYTLRKEAAKKAAQEKLDALKEETEARRELGELTEEEIRARAAAEVAIREELQEELKEIDDEARKAQKAKDEEEAERKKEQAKKLIEGALTFAETVSDAIADIADMELERRSENIEELQKKLEEGGENLTAAEKAQLEKRIQKEKEAALSAFRVKQAMALVDLAIATIVASMAAFQLGPLPGAIASAALIAAGAVSAAQIASQQPPQFFRGGMIGGVGLTPDQSYLVAERGEGVLSRQGVAAAGGPEGVASLNRGGGSPQVIVVQQVYGHRVFDAFVQDNLQRSGPLGKALRRGRRAGRGPRRVRAHKGSL